MAPTWAYKSVFFSDPRTRAEYIEWAPLLLEAEEFYAGNREVDEPPPPRTRESSPEGRATYRRRKLIKALIGKTVRLTRDVTTMNGKRLKAGSLWRVLYNEHAGITILQLTKAGKKKPDEIRLGGMQLHDIAEVELDE